MLVKSLPQESEAYRARRAELQAAELALRDQREKVAELRRSLPGDTPLADHQLREWRDGAVHDVALSDLFEMADKPLVLMQFMFGANEHLCPMCAMWADGYNAVQKHMAAHMNFVVLIAGDPQTFATKAEERGWNDVRVVSAGDSSIKRDLGFEDDEGGQMPGVSVVSRAADGSLVHHYSQSAMYGNGEYRGMDLLSPVWHFVDLLPNGRGDWLPSLS